MNSKNAESDALDLVSSTGGRRERIIYKVVLTGGKVYSSLSWYEIMAFLMHVGGVYANLYTHVTITLITTAVLLH